MTRYLRNRQVRRTVECPYQRPVTAAMRARWAARGVPTPEEFLEIMGRRIDAELMALMATAIVERKVTA